MRRSLLPALLASLTLTGCSVFGAKAAEEPDFEVQVTDGAFEVRRYGEQVIARTTVEADEYGEATGAAFNRLAGYIFGDNRARSDDPAGEGAAADSEKIAMTAPVLMEKKAATGGDEAESASDEGEKIAMTAPVLMERKSTAGDEPEATEPAASEEIAMTAPVLMEDTGESWEMVFYLPEGYTVESAPLPVDPEVEITTLPGKTVAVVTFSGRLRQELIDRHTAELERWIEARDYRAVSPPRAAGYNPPWTVPALRRNEIQIDVEPTGGS